MKGLEGIKHILAEHKQKIREKLGCSHSWRIRLLCKGEAKQVK